MEKKVICVINSSNNGGAQKMITALYKELKKENQLNKIVYLEKIESQYSNIEGASYLSNSLSSIKDYVVVVTKLYKLIKKEKPDVLISFLPLSNILSSSIGRLLGVKTRIASQRNPPQIYGKVVKLLDRFLGQHNFYSYNVGNSQSVFDAFDEYPLNYKKHLRIINNCVEKPDFSISVENAKNLLNIPNERIVLTCVGRLHEQKNHEVIIKAMEYVENAYLYLGGDGPLREDIEKLIEEKHLSDKVILLGNLEREQVRTLLRASSVFLIPSKYEGLSNSLIEALSYGLPILCSNIPSFVDFLKNDKGIDGYSGRIVNDNSPNEWADQINKLLSNEDSLKEYASLSLKRVEELTPQKMCKNFQALFSVNNIDK